MAMRSVLSLGLKPPRVPSDAAKEITFPEDITVLTPEELGYQMTVWTNLLNFADYQKTLMGNDVEIVRSKLEESVNGRVASSKGATVAEKKARAKSAPELQDLREQLEHGQAAYGLLVSFCEMYSRNYAAISREISRRIGAPPE